MKKILIALIIFIALPAYARDWNDKVTGTGAGDVTTAILTTYTAPAAFSGASEFSTASAVTASVEAKITAATNATAFSGATEFSTASAVTASVQAKINTYTNIGAFAGVSAFVTGAVSTVTGYGTYLVPQLVLTI